jgi:hypothetical protein
LPDGVWVALLALLFYGLERLKNDTDRKKVSIVLSIILVPSSIFLLTGGIRTALVTNSPVYIPGSQAVAFEFLAEHVEDDSVVLTTYLTGNALPAWAPVRVVIGHGPESAGLEELQPAIERFYSPEMSEQERISLLTRYSVDYVFWEKDESDWEFKETDYLQIIYEQEGEKIYQVRLQMQPLKKP